MPRQLGPVPPNHMSPTARAFYLKSWVAFATIRDGLNNLMTAKVTRTAEIDTARANQQSYRAAISGAADADTAFNLEQQLRQAIESERVARAALAAVNSELPAAQARYAAARADLDITAGIA